MVSHTEGGTKADGVREWGAEENISAYEKRGNTAVKKNT
jgi:hypothetical protein